MLIFVTFIFLCFIFGTSTYSLNNLIVYKKIGNQNQYQRTSFVIFSEITLDESIKLPTKTISAPVVPVKRKVYELRADRKTANPNSSTTSNYQSNNKNNNNKWKPNPSQQFKPESTSQTDPYKQSKLIFILTKPQLLIRYKAPKEATELKIRLKSMQDGFRQQAERNYASQQDSHPSYSSSPPSFSEGGEKRYDKVSRLWMLMYSQFIIFVETVT